MRRITTHQPVRYMSGQEETHDCLEGIDAYLLDEDVRQVGLLQLLQRADHLCCFAAAQVLLHRCHSCGLVLHCFIGGRPSCGAAG